MDGLISLKRIMNDETLLEKYATIAQTFSQEKGPFKLFALVTTIDLNQGEHAGSPLQPLNMRDFVGADLCVCL